MCRVPVYIDSPLATRLTDIYRDHQEGLDADVQETLKLDDDIFDFRRTDLHSVLAMKASLLTVSGARLWSFLPAACAKMVESFIISSTCGFRARKTQCDDYRLSG